MNKFYRLYIEKIVYSFPCITVTEENHLNPDDIDSYIVSESRSVVREHETEDAAIAHAKRYVEWSQKKGFKPVVWDWDTESTNEEKITITFTQPVIVEFTESERTIIPNNGMDCWDLGDVDDHWFAQDISDMANGVLYRLGKGMLIHPNKRFDID